MFGRFFFSSAENKSVIQAIAIHAGILPEENQPQQKALERAASPVAVHIKALAARALAEIGPGCPHVTDLYHVDEC